MKHIEDTLQQSCYKWFTYQYKGIRLHHSPNGGHRSITEATRFKRMGTQAGHPDFVLYVANGGYNGLFIELKTDKGIVTEKQSEFHADVKRAGYLVEVCRSFEQFKSIIENYLEA